MHDKLSVCQLFTTDKPNTDNMKLQLPKNLLVAVLCCITATAYGVTFNSSSIVTPEEGGKSYLNVGTENATDNWSGNLVVGDTDTTQGDVDYVGAFTESWGWVTPNGGSSNTTITSGLKVSGALTVQEGGKIVLGGQYKGGSSYLGLEATAGITVAGGSLTATKVITTDLTITKGSVSTNTSNCTSGNSYAGGSKQSYIKNSLTISGGTVSFGYNANVQGIGGGSHRMTAFGSSSSFKVNQTDGTLRVYGDMDLKSGSTFTQSGGTMVLRDTIYMGGSGTTTFNQSGDDSKLVLGRLESTGSILSKPQCDYVINQSGKGLVHLAYGSNLYKAGTIALNQTGAGTIKIGGEHDTSITGALPSRGYALAGSFEAINTTYSIQQSGGGNILVKNGAAINASSVNLTNGTLQVEKDAIVTTNTLSAGTSTVARNATAALTASNVTLTNGTLSTEGDTVTNSATMTVEKLVLNSGVFVNNGSIKALASQADAARIMLSGNGTDFAIVINGGEFQNYGNCNESILVDGGTLTLEDATIDGDVVVNAGTVNVTSNSTLTSLTLDADAVLNVSEGAIVTLTEADGLTIADGVTIMVTVSTEMLENLDDQEFTLFSGNVSNLTNANIIFTDNNEETEDKQANISLGSTSGSIKVDSTVAIPEPTTATLSLLALAGLCARRRRR